jgi:hypothetical protein
MNKPYLVCSIDICPSVQQQSDYLQVPEVSGLDERCRSFLW